MDRLETMRVFVTVAEANGFAAAARKLGMSPPAVTRAVAAVEKRVGAQLFRRSTRLVKLTDAGARFLISCKRILGDVEEAETAAAGSQKGLTGPLSVTASVMFGRLFVAPILLDFTAEHAAVTPRLLLSDRIVDLLDEGIDVAVRIAHLPEESQDVAVKVGSVRRIACASPAYLARHGVPKAPSDLATHSAVVFSHGAAPAALSFRAGGRVSTVRPKPALVVNSTEVSITAALAGRGITAALSYQIAGEIERGDLVPLLEAFELPAMPVHVVYREGRRAPERVRAFVRFATERLRAEAALAFRTPPRRRSR